MARSVIIPSRNYTSGQHSFSLPQIPQDTAGVKITMLRENWPAALVATVNIEISFDNGVTWRHWFGFGLTGGNILRDGILQLNSFMQSTWPGEFDGKDAQGRDKRRALKGTDIRVTLDTNRTFRSTVTLEAI